GGGGGGQAEGPAGIGRGQQRRRRGGRRRAGAVAGLPLLALDPPEDRQAEVAVGPPRHRHGEAQHDVVEAEPQDLAAPRGEDRVAEDAAEGDLGPALVAEGVVDDQPDHAAGDQSGEDERGQDDPQVVPLPGGGVEDGVGGVVVPPGGQPGGLPDIADGVRAGAGDPAGEQGLGGLEDLDGGAVAQRRYQFGQAGDKLVHGGGPLGVAGVSWGCYNLMRSVNRRAAARARRGGRDLKRGRDGPRIARASRGLAPTGGAWPSAGS